MLILLALVSLAGCAGAPGPTAASTAAPATAPTADPLVAAAARGRDLFRNKGCVTCHANQRVEGRSGVRGFVAPDLTGYRNSPEFLRRWLADPAQARPGATMPNLRLAPAEIDDLVAFMNEPR
jgi:mono/diheme cytochrome c family protein